MIQRKGRRPARSFEETLGLYDKHFTKLMLAKITTWRSMARHAGELFNRPYFAKLLRVKQIEDNQGKTLVSEGLDANYQDMINYAVFALIHLDQ